MARISILVDEIVKLENPFPTFLYMLLLFLAALIGSGIAFSVCFLCLVPYLESDITFGKSDLISFECVLNFSIVWYHIGS